VARVFSSHALARDIGRREVSPKSRDVYSRDVWFREKLNKWCGKFFSCGMAIAVGGKGLSKLDQNGANSTKMRENPNFTM
jgi:hypothetical protein